MGVVESNQPVAAGAMQCQRVVQPMWPVGGGNYPADCEPNPVLALSVDHEYLAIEIQQHFRASIRTPPFHLHKVITY